MEIIKIATIIIVFAVVIALPAIIAAWVGEEYSWAIGAPLGLVMYAIIIAVGMTMFGGNVIAIGEVYAKEHIDAHVYKETNSGTGISSGGQAVLTSYTSMNFHPEMYTIHLRAMSDKGYVRQQYIVTFEQFEEIELGEIVDTEGMSRYDE